MHLLVVQKLKNGDPIIFKLTAPHLWIDKQVALRRYPMAGFIACHVHRKPSRRVVQSRLLRSACGGSLRTRYELSRIQLPDYKETCHYTTGDQVRPPNPLLFSDLFSRAFFSGYRMQNPEGVNTCDFPLVFLAKAMRSGLSEYSPPVAQLLQRLFLEEKVSLEIEGMMESEKLGVVSAVCKWMKTEKNRPVWEAWLPPSQYRVECELGEIVDGKKCTPCTPGTFSGETYATKCLPCAAGYTRPPAIVRTQRR